MALPERNIAGERIVLTGATNGIGKELARGLAARGAALTLLARNEAKANATAAELGAESGASGEPDVIICDLADLGSVRAAATQLEDTYAAIDVLVNNAGIQTYSGEETVDGYEAMLATNHLGPFLLTNLLLEPLRAAAPARIVITASEAHRTGDRPPVENLAAPEDFGRAGAQRRYGRSKLMNILFARELAGRLEGTGVTANCFCPGMVATGLVRDNRFLDLAGQALSRTPLIRRPEQGARMGIRLVVDPDLEAVSGEFFTSTPGMRFLPTAPALGDADYRRRVWERSAVLVGL